MVIKVEDVMGYFVNEQFICYDCASQDEEQEATQDEVVIRDDIESGDNLYFCDRCNKQVG